MDDVGLDLEVNCDEVGGVGVVGVDSAEFCGSEDDLARLHGSEEGVDGGLDGKVEFRVGSEDEVGEAEGFKLANYGGSDKAPVAGNEDFDGFVGDESAGAGVRHR